MCTHIETRLHSAPYTRERCGVAADALRLGVGIDGVRDDVQADLGRCATANRAGEMFGGASTEGDGIQVLLKAEQEAQKIVGDARKGASRLAAVAGGTRVRERGGSGRRA